MVRRVFDHTKALGYAAVVTLTMLTTVWSSLGLVLVPHREAGHSHHLELVAEEAYPCQGHNCGCKSAADCRAGCCCFPAAPRPSAPPLAEEDASDAPTTRLTLRADSCAGTVARIMMVHRTSWLPTTPPAAWAHLLCYERVQPFSPQTPACRPLAVDPPPPRRSA